MPNSALRCGLPSASRSNASRLRRAQRSDRRIDSAACACVAGLPSTSNGVHSSKTIVTSAFSTPWMRIDSSGVSNRRSPFTGEAKRTPSSLILRSWPSENT